MTVTTPTFSDEINDVFGNYIKDGRGSLFSRANKMKELGANTKTELDKLE